MVNIRTKGAGGEREIADDLNYIVYQLMQELGHPNPTMSSIQRNQNQTAVGGADLTGTFDLAIEVKRQEALSINTWWAQCERSAITRNETPVLLFRQNGKKWRCIMYTHAALPVVPKEFMPLVKVRSELDYDTFKQWFREWARRKMENGYEVKV